MINIDNTSLLASRENHHGACANLQVKWDISTDFDETKYIESLVVKLSSGDRDSDSIVTAKSVSDKATVILSNQSGRYSVWNPGSELYQYISHRRDKGIPVRIGLGYLNPVNPETINVLNGYIESIDASIPNNIATMVVRDASMKMLNYRCKTPLYLNKSVGFCIEKALDSVPIEDRPSIANGTLLLDSSVQAVRVFYIDESDGLWRSLSDLAAVDGGKIEIEPVGDSWRLVYRNVTYPIVSSQTIRHIINVSSYEELASMCEFTDWYNHFTVDFSESYIGSTRPIWTLDKPRFIRKMEVIKIEAKFDEPAYSVEPIVIGRDYSALTPGGEIRKTYAYIVAKFYNPNSGPEVDEIFAKSTNIYAYNNGDSDLYLNKCIVRGRLISSTKRERVSAYIDDSGNFITDPASVSTRSGWNSLPVQENRFIKSRDDAYAYLRLLADKLGPVTPSLIARYGNIPVRLRLKLVGIPGLPWIRYGDYVVVNIANVATSIGFYVDSVDHKFSGDGMSTDIEATSSAGMFSYPNFFRFGVNRLGSRFSDSGRMWL